MPRAPRLPSVSRQPPAPNRPTSSGARTGPRSGRSGRSSPPCRTSTTGRSAPCRPPVLEEQQSWRARMEANPVRFFVREQPAALGAGPGRDRRSSSVPSPSSLAFVRNATAGASTRAVVPRARARRRDPASPTIRTARSASRRSGGPPTRVPASSSAHVPLRAADDEVTAAVLGAVTDRTRLAVVDHVTSPTARRMPLVSLLPALQGARHRCPRRRRPRRGHARGRPRAAGRGLLGRQPAQVVLRAPRDRRAARVRGAPAAGCGPLVASWGEPAGFPDVVQRGGHRGPHGLAGGAAGPAAARPARLRPAAPAQRRAGGARAAGARARHWAWTRPTCRATRP